MAKASKKGDLKKHGKSRASDELELIKLILDENKDLKKRVMRFIQKSLGKSPSATAKMGKKGARPV